MFISIGLDEDSRWLDSMTFDDYRLSFMKQKNQPNSNAPIIFYGAGLREVIEFLVDFEDSGSPGKAFNLLKNRIQEQRENSFSEMTKGMSKRDLEELSKWANIEASAMVE